MFNKSKLKKYINDGKKDTLMFEKSQGWIIDGYAMYTLNDPMMLEVLNEIYFNTDKLGIRLGKPGDPIKMEQIIERDYQDAKPLELTPYVHGDGKYVARIFLETGGNEVRCQQKYLDVLDNYRKYRYTQTHSVAPIYIWNGEETMIGLILPIRQNEIDGFKVARL